MMEGFGKLVYEQLCFEAARGGSVLIHLKYLLKGFHFDVTKTDKDFYILLFYSEWRRLLPHLAVLNLHKNVLKMN